MNPQLQMMLQQAIQAFQGGNFDRADSILKKVIQADSKNLPALHVLGLIKASQQKYQEAAELLKRAVRLDPNEASIRYNLAKALVDCGSNEESLPHHQKAVELMPQNPEAWLNYGKALSNLARDEEAVTIYDRALTINPNYVEAWLNKSNTQFALKLYEKALVSYDQVILLSPENVGAQINKGATLCALERYQEAIDYFDKLISHRPDFAEAWLNKGSALQGLNRFDEAITCFDQAIKLKPDYAEAWSNKGKALYMLKRHGEAIEHYDKAISIYPHLYDALINKGAAFQALKHHEQAIFCYEQALTLKPDYAEGWSNKGVALNDLKRYEEAIAHYDRALSLKPDYAEGWSNKGNALNDLKRYEEAITHYDQALSLKPDYAQCWSNKGNALNLLRRHDQSAQCYFKALELSATKSYLLGQAHHQMMLTCDWRDYEKITQQIFSYLEQDEKVAEPFGFQGIAQSEELLQKCAQIYSSDKFPALGNLAGQVKYTHQKIRIGYLCGEFREQATTILMARIWELHNHSQFEIIAFDNGWNDHSSYRMRIEEAFDKVIDISRLSDLEAAKCIQEEEIDILVNLNGFFGLSRQGVFAYKAAPVQVNYLGFPGTIGAPYIDYLIADKTVIPPESCQYYAEKIAYLPNSYQANDNLRTISPRTFTKAELGLPENSFVFACFNNSYKITPTTFNLWSRILSQVSNSVLWILVDNSIAKENLKKEAIARGIDPSRLIFADRLEPSEHLARHQLADLFLDTSPYNAHTTASDALWSGLPILALQGTAFPGRVAASLLRAVGLVELIANSEEEYVSLAIELALHPEKLRAMKDQLMANRLVMPLFNSSLFTQQIEAAYQVMYERYQAGLMPDHFEVK